MAKTKLALHWKILTGLILGIAWAVFSSFLNLSEFTLNWIDPFGTIFIKLLKLIAVPLVLFSIIGGVAGIGNPESLGRMGLKTISLYISTTVLAVSIGLVLSNIIAPGKFINQQAKLENRINYELWANQNSIQILDGECQICDSSNAELIQKISVQSGQSADMQSVESHLNTIQSRKNVGPLHFFEEIVPSNIFVALTDNASMLQIIFFAIFFGISLLFVPNKSSEPVLNFVNGVNDALIKMVEIIMAASPYFVFALMAGVVSKMAGDDVNKVLEIFKGLSGYTALVIFGLLTMVLGVYPLILRIFIGKGFGYRRFFKGISEAQALAFSTSSSAATLPVTMECVEENLGVDKRVTSFVLPIGATVNMDGTSMYQAIAVIFLAHFHGVDLTLVQQLIIILTATLASIGSAAVPGAGLVMLMIVLETVGLNPAWIAIIMPVDRILDMLRTVVNVTGDAAVSTIIDKTEKLR